MIAAPVPAMASSDARDLAAYLRARAADADGAAGVAATAYAQALGDDPQNPLVAARAYRSAVLAGDFALLRRAGAVLQQAGITVPDAGVLTLAEAVQTGDPVMTAKALDRIGKSGLDFLVPPIKAWLALPDAKAAEAALDAVGSNPIGKRYAAESRAMVLIATGRADAGIAQLQVMLGADRGSFDLRFYAARLLAGQGRQDAAAALLIGDAPAIDYARRHIGDGAAATPGFGLAMLFTQLAGDIGTKESAKLAEVLTRAALRLDPGNDRARLLLAEALAADSATAFAIEANAAIGPTSAYYPAAQVQRIDLLDQAGQVDQAIGAAAALAARPAASSDDIRRHAALLLEAGQAEAAAAQYRRAVARAGSDVDWVLLLQFGSALDRAGNWRAAKPVIERAVALAPDEPLVLNYLGYSLLEQGGDLAAARKLLERAHRLRPDDFAILDSLAWAYFKQGDVAQALPLLERAAAGEPGNSAINEHLGDAYWHTGRRYEARYAWQAAVIQAAAGDAARLSAKIVNGPAAH